MNMFQGSFYVPIVNTTSSIRFYVCFLSYPNRLSEQSILGAKRVQRREGVKDIRWYWNSIKKTVSSV